MGKRIWGKKPGTVAWKKAMQKSASRMARDLLKAPEGKAGKICGSYVANKSVLERHMIIRGQMVGKALARRKKMLLAAEQEYNHLREQCFGLKRDAERISRAYGMAGNRLQMLKRCRNSAEAILNSAKGMAEKLSFFEKNLPKKDAGKFRERRQMMEKGIANLIEKIANVEERIKKMEQK